jgi:hypothetical protein
LLALAVWTGERGLAWVAGIPLVAAFALSASVRE